MVHERASNTMQGATEIPGPGFGQPNSRSGDKVFNFSTIGGIIIALFFSVWGILTILSWAPEWIYPAIYQDGTIASLTWLQWFGVDLTTLGDSTITLIHLSPVIWGGVIAFVLFQVRTDADWAAQLIQILLGVLSALMILGTVATCLDGADIKFPLIIAILTVVWYYMMVGAPFGSWKGVLDINYFFARKDNYSEPVGLYPPQ